MWIMTSGGFVSAVADQSDPDTLKVRARDRVSLETMVAGICLATEREPEELPIVTGVGTDYPYRIFVKRRDFAAWLVIEVMNALTYANFKNELKHERGEAWASAASKIWWALMENVTDDEGNQINIPYYGDVVSYRRGATGSWTTDDITRSGVWDETEDAVFLASERQALGLPPTTSENWFLSSENRAALQTPQYPGRRKRRGQKKEAKRLREQRMPAILEA